VIVVMTDVYEYVDENEKKNINVLTIDVHFDGATKLEDALKIVDNLKRSKYVKDNKLKVIPAIYTVSPMSDIADKVK